MSHPPARKLTEPEDIRFFEIVKKAFSAVAKDDIVFFGDGYDHDVFVVNKTEVFRFPKNEKAKVKDKIEINFMNLFESPIPVPKMKLNFDELTSVQYQTYQYIEGVPFTRDLAQKMSLDERYIIADQLGVFLRAVHSFPVESARSLKLDEIVSAQDYADYWFDFLKEIKQTMYQYFSSSEQEWIENLFGEHMTAVKENSYLLAVTHNDVLPHHILINPDNHALAGVIDFTGLRISDPAHDFAYFDRYGNDFVARLLSTYQIHTKDVSFEVRRKFYSGVLGFTFLSNARKNNEDEKIPKIIEQIHEYIFGALS